MKYPTENDVKKLGPVIRVMAGFILFCGIFTAAVLVFVAITEPFHPSLFAGIALTSLMGHVAGSVAFKGYAPKYLLFAHGTK